MNDYTTLEFDTILGKLSEHAVSEAAKARCLAVVPAQRLADAKRLSDETGEARMIIEQHGTPPIAVMTDLEKIMGLLNADAMLIPEQITHVASFLSSCKRLSAYLHKAEYGNALLDVSALEEEITRCIHNERVDDRATPQLYTLRRGIERKGEQIKNKIEGILQKNKQYCTDGYVAVRNGRYTMPVKKEYKNKIPGILVEISNTGGTCFIEPSAVSLLQEELATLQIEEDNEVRTILYTLTAIIHDELPTLKANKEAMEAFDFIFAKGKLSLSMKASPIRLTEEREIRLLCARHPLLADGVPLDFALGGETRGIIITGPNTGGKTVAIKTVGLLSLMAQSGLHVPADAQSSVCIFDAVRCDIGDGQSISQNLSTFSSHMNNIINILAQSTAQSLFLFDELGSGTDPAEGMGIATAILEELLNRGCLFTVTTHYPEIKDFANRTKGVLNAKMAFDRESLLPLYRLEIGKAGESCALYIAERLGLPTHILNRAREITYATPATPPTPANDTPREGTPFIVKPLEIDETPPPATPIPRSMRFNVGDSVVVYPKKEIGIVYERANVKGEINVQIKGKKQLINHKRLQLKVAAAELYPEDYDFSIIFDSVENRKARHLMSRKHVEGNVVIQKEG